MNRHRILIADDHRLFAEGLRVLLEPEFEVVGLVQDGNELIEAAKTILPDVIVTDVSMPSRSGLEAAASFRCDFARLRDDGISGMSAQSAGSVAYFCEWACSHDVRQ